MDRDPTAYTGDSEAPVAVMVAGDTAAPRTVPPVNTNGTAWTICGTNEEKARCPLRIYIRLIGQLVRPAPPDLCQRADTAGLNWRNALTISPDFSVLLDVPRPDGGPSVDLAGGLAAPGRA
jgi:hypothetical protein